MLTVSFYVNAFSPKSRISDHMSPITIVEGVKLVYNKHVKVIPGKYSQTFEGLDNTMKEQTIRAITLGPAGNLQGGVRFFSLKTGQILNRSSKDFLLLPIPADVVTRVHAMAKSSPRGIIFPNWKHIDELDNEFNSSIMNKGITGMNDTNTNTDIKCAKDSDDDELRDLPNLEDIARVVDDDDDDDDDDEDIYKDMPWLREQDKDEDNEDEEDYTYTNNKGIPGVTTRSGQVVK